MLLTALLLCAQAVAIVALLRRILPGRHRLRPVTAHPPRLEDVGTVTALVAALNEAERISPCLDGLRHQSATLAAVIVVDSHSTDGTAELVASAADRDPRLQLINDPPLPVGWIGKVWALQHGLAQVTTDWVVGIDADTESRPTMIDAVLAAARAGQYDVVSFAPRFDGLGPIERWLQPALLVTLIYRFGVPGNDSPPARMMANGQCFLARRAVLVEHGGYSSSRASFADDISLARHLAARGVRVGFLDGSEIITVRAYRSAWEMWREWGRSIDASDATTPLRQWADVAYLALLMGAPLPILIAAAFLRIGPLAPPLIALNVMLLALRWGVQAGIASSYTARGPAFWLSPLADPLAVVRILLSTSCRPRRWRGRVYS